MIKQFFFVLALLFMVGSAPLYAAPLVIPQAQASHFCQLLISDGTSVSTLSTHADKAIQPADSLTVEQIFAGYVLLADGWQTMRIFPHLQGNAVSWYSATDELPATMSDEHQKYIREVFPRLITQVQAGQWQAVDEYVDKMLQYQCQFGGEKVSASVSTSLLTTVAVIFLIVILVSRFLFVLLYPKRKKQL
jgi:hypothetical protein